MSFLRFTFFYTNLFLKSWFFGDSNRVKKTSNRERGLGRYNVMPHPLKPDVPVVSFCSFLNVNLSINKVTA